MSNDPNHQNRKTFHRPTNAATNTTPVTSPATPRANQPPLTQCQQMQQQMQQQLLQQQQMQAQMQAQMEAQMPFNPQLQIHAAPEPAVAAANAAAYTAAVAAANAARPGVVPHSSATSGRPTSSGSNSSKCTHQSHQSQMSLTAVASAQQLSTEHYKRQLQKYRDEAALSGGDTARINGQLNEIFLRRLQEIDCAAEGDIDLKLVTYQEWVDILLQINEAIIGNMEDLESEVAERLELVQRKMNSSCRPNPALELAKYRKDIATLLKVVQNGYHHDCWNLQGLQFETVTPAQVFGCNERQSIENEGGYMQSPMHAQECAQRNKLTAHMKALAVEVADKHDELRELKKQICCMEDEVQKAQQKIQLKDDVIKELRADLKCANAKLSNKSSGVTFLQMPPVNLEVSQQTSRSATTQVSEGLECTPLMYDGCQFESLSDNEHLEQQKLKVLEEELNELFEMTKDLKKQNLEYHRKRLSDIFQKSEAEKAEAYRKLDHIRRQLIDLEATSAEAGMRNWNDCDSGFSSKSENDQDAKILDAVRRRIRKLNECSFELKKRVQKLEIEKNDLSSSLETEKSFSACNSATLKEIADLLSTMSGQQFSYKDIYNKQSKQNPFVEAIINLKNCFAAREEQLICNTEMNNQKVAAQMEELKAALYSSEQQLGQLGPNSRVVNNPITTTTAATTLSTASTLTLAQDTIQLQSAQQQQEQRIE